MGADLILAIAVTEKDWKRPETWEITRKVSEWVSGKTNDELEDMYLKSDVDDESPSADEWIETLTEVVVSAGDALAGYRDVSIWHVGDLMIWVVGGTSWGDDPSDGFSDLNRAWSLDDAGFPIQEWLNWVPLDQIEARRKEPDAQVPGSQ